MLVSNKVCCCLGCCFLIYRGYWFWCRGLLHLLALLFLQKLKAKSSSKEYTQFCDHDYWKILKHVIVLWLSLEKAVDWTLMQYDSLRSCFLSQDDPKWKTSETQSEFTGIQSFKCLKKQFEDPLTQVAFIFIIIVWHL